MMPAVETPSTAPAAFAAMREALGFAGDASNKAVLRETRMRLRAIKSGTTQQLIINVIADSYGAGDYWSPVFAKALHTEYGMAGVGFVGFGFYANNQAQPFSEGGTQPSQGGPSTVDGNVRPDLVAKPIFIGTWNSGPGTGSGLGYNRGSSAQPNLSYAESSTAGDRIKVAFPAGHDSSRIFYWGSVAGSFRYSWDGGSTWQTTISYAGAGGALSAVLANTPAGAATVIFEVVSGTVQLGGVDLKSSASGVRVNKLCASGSATNSWSLAATANSQWRSRMGELGAKLHIIGFQTNDQGSAFDPDTTYTTQLGNIITALRLVDPNCDILLTSPPENQRTNNAFPMSRYTAATRALAVTQNCAHLDHQFNFGVSAADYENTSGRPWYGSDKIHPVAATGGAVLADATLDALRPR